MPTLDFPNNPSPGQQYNAPNNVQYTWSTEGVWTAISGVQPSPNPPAVSTPTILSPPNGSTGVGGSGGLTVSATSFSGINNPGTHQSSDWQLSLDGPLLVSTNSISSVTQGPSSTTLSLAGGLADGFANGDVVSNGLSGPNRAEGTITNITPTSVAVSPGSTNWLPTQFLNRGTPVLNISASTTSLTSLAVSTPPLTADTTYYTRVRYRSSTSVLSEWSPWSEFATGSLVNPFINTPTVVSPPNGATNVGDSSGVLLEGSAYSQSGAGPQTSAVWEVYENGYPIVSTNTVTSVSTQPPFWNISSSQGFNQNPLRVKVRGLWSMIIHEAGTYQSLLPRPNIMAITNNPNSLSVWNFVVPYGEDPFGPSDLDKTDSTWMILGRNDLDSYAVRYYTSDDDFATAKVDRSSAFVSALGYPRMLTPILAASPSIALASVVPCNTSGNPIAGAQRIMRSTDNGLTWVNTGVFYNSIAFVEDRFFATSGTGNDASLYYSMDGSSWTEITSTAGGWVGAPPPLARSIIYGNNEFVGFTANGVIYSSVDGVSWDFKYQPSGGVTSIGYGQGVYAYCFFNTFLSPTYYYSSDLTNWTNLSIPTPFLYSLVGELIFFAPSCNQWATSVASQSSYVREITYADSLTNLTVLNISGASSDGFEEGDPIVSLPSGAQGTVSSLTNSLVRVANSSGTWTGKSIQLDSSSYSPITGSPFTKTSGNLLTLNIPASSLEVSTEYFARVKYGATTPSPAQSNFSPWSSFITKSSFA